MAREGDVLVSPEPWEERKLGVAVPAWVWILPC